MCLWIELVFCKLTVMQQFLVRLTLYCISSIFKCQSIAVVLVGPLPVARWVLWKRVWLVFCPSMLSSVWHFFGIGSLDFSEFLHGAKSCYKFVHDRARVFGKTFFFQKNWEKGQKQGFLNLKKNLAINFHWICPIMKIYIICCSCTNLYVFGKNLVLEI